ncbi:MAG: hypothetical protein JWN25_2744, partial [Verrucomicrobiales bacterium]|nr:hypothetical protein [Verrucomicrobiales bacterium]
VVYNHTAEGNHLGPTLSFKGIDNASYYRLVKDDRRYYMDYTGTGNTLNLVHPRVLQLVMDSLRYWVTEMHVDGFRFDLAPALARELHEVSKLSAFFDVIHQDPVISQVKLIAEPWDVGEGGYQVGNFPVLWSEWNGKYRDSLRRYWKGDEGLIKKLGNRLSGSPDLYESSGKRPYASINFLTSHDGFSLHDLVSYNDKHNEANREDNKDGDNNNNCWNCGAEGTTDDELVLRLRRRQMRNMLTSLFLSQGVPMLSAGDEYGRTQRGNNNAYCQDSEISWLRWDRSEDEERQTDFVKKLIQFRNEHPVFHREKFFQGREIRGSGVKDIMWLNGNGEEMTDDEWNTRFIRCLGVFYSGEFLEGKDAKGAPIRDDNFLLLLNAHHEPVNFTLPKPKGTSWEVVIDTIDEAGFVLQPEYFELGSSIEVEPRALLLLKLVSPEPHPDDELSQMVKKTIRKNRNVGE